MRYLRYLLLGGFGVAVVCVAIANRSVVAVQLLPEVLGDVIGFNLGFSLPLFIVMLICVMLGLILGFIWEWIREMGERSAARREHKYALRLEREVSRLKADKNRGKDDVLALLEDI